MLGDGLAHISFAGIALGLTLGIYPLGVALVASVLGALAIQLLRSRNVVRGDTAIGILFTAGLALGVLIVSRGRGFGVDVTSYLFGNLLSVTGTDILLVGGVGAALLALLLLLHKEMFAITFSEEAARLSGLPVGVLNTLFTALTAASVVVAARIVGILLVSALLVVPAATGLQLAKSFRQALAYSVAFGLASVVVGVFAAAQWGLATGASVALASTAFFALTVGGRELLGRLSRSGA